MAAAAAAAAWLQPLGLAFAGSDAAYAALVDVSQLLALVKTSQARGAATAHASAR